MSWKELDRPTRFVALILVVAVAWHAWWASHGWRIQGLMSHEFRQAQTAVSVQAMKEDGFRLDYATPVLGKPWSIPMEFPLYEFLAAEFSRATGASVVESGRWVSLLSFYLALPALFLIGRAVGLSRAGAGVALLPVLGAPMYLFYSRTVLIEATAFAGGAWFLACALHYRNTQARGWLVATWLCGAAGVLVKVTTWAAFGAGWGVAILWAWWLGRGTWRATSLRLLREGVLVIGPVLVVGQWWIWQGDQIKLENPLAEFLLSKNLTAFNFGTLAQRLDPTTWTKMFEHWSIAILPWWSLVAACVGAAFAPVRTRWLALGGLATFLGAQLVFTNLYFVHDYYHYATSAFLALTCGAVAWGLWEAGGARRWGGAALLGVVLGGQFCAYRVDEARGYFVKQTAPLNGDTALTKALRQMTHPGEVLVIHGKDWSSVIPFYAERRALMIPDSQMYGPPENVRRAVAAIKGEKIPLVLFFESARDRKDWIAQRIRDFNLHPEPLFESAEYKVVGYAAENAWIRGLYVLRAESLPGLTVHGESPVLSSNEVQPLGAARFSGVLEDFSPTPERGLLPQGLWLLKTDERRVFMAHTPTELYFRLPPGAKKVELSYRVFAEAFAKPDFDGVGFKVELRENGKPPQVLFEDWIPNTTPPGQRGIRQRELPLPAGAEGEVVVSTNPGPHGNGAFDWGLFDRIAIK